MGINKTLQIVKLLCPWKSVAAVSRSLWPYFSQWKSMAIFRRNWLFLFSLLFLFSFFFIPSSFAGIYINNYPEDITINEGDPLDVPIFFAGGELTGKPVELFVWKEDVEEPSIKEYLAEGGWAGFTGYPSMEAVGQLSSMIEYIRIVWRAFDNTAGMSSFNLYVCIDGSIDGQLPAGADTSGASCGVRKINIIPSSGGNCTGLYVYNTSGGAVSSINETLEKGKTKSITLNVKDSCNQPVSFTATKTQNWITLSSQTGSLTVTLNASFQPSTDTDTIALTGGGSTKTINVSMTVTAPTLGLPGGGGGTCTPSSISVWPVSITASAGETKTATASVANNCGQAISYTASVTSGNSWLSVSGSGSGTMTVTANTSGMNAGTYYGKVKVSSSGYADVTFDVILTITGPCEAASAVVDPISISKSVTAGSNATDSQVTVKNNCGAGIDYTVTGIDYTVTGVSGSWISTPSAGTGSLTVKYNTSGLSAGNYNGSISLDLGQFGTKRIQISLSVTSGGGGGGGGDAVLLKNFEIQYYSYSPGQVRYFYFHENSSKGQGNNYPLIVSQMDMKQGSSYDIDMIVKYAGPNCEYGKPTIEDHRKAKNGEITSGENNLYFRLKSTAFETVEINPPNPEGCYYVMVINADDASESRISIKYEDSDSY